MWLLACQALGLGSETKDGVFTLDNGLAHALLRPSLLFGRMRAVTPRKAAKALRFCADGLGPQGAWELIGQELRESRLKELAGILEKTEDGVPITRLTEWSHKELIETLTHFSMQKPFCPWVMADADGAATWPCGPASYMRQRGPVVWPCRKAECVHGVVHAPGANRNGRPGTF